MSLQVEDKTAKSAVDDRRYRSLQIKYLQAENVYNKYLLKFTNKILDNISDYKNPSKDELNKALEKARAEFEQMQEALEAEKAYREVKMELEKECASQIEELKPYFME